MKQDESWMKKMLSKGTYKDRISTLCIYARDNAKYSLKTVENLLEMVQFLLIYLISKTHFYQNIIKINIYNQCNTKSKRDS